jgi:hypothetical protein
MMATTTAPPSQQPQQQKPTDDALIAAIIAAFLAGHTIAAIVSRLRKPFARAGIGTTALKAGVAVVLSMPEQPVEGIGPATMWSVRTNTLRRSAFTLASVRRIQKAADDAKAQGGPVIDAIMAQVAKEKAWFSSHVSASQNRMAAASAVDGMAGTHGDLLGWQATKDSRCSPGCRRASGRNFRASDPPVIEGSPSLPGAVHPACRCRPVPAWPGAPVMAGVSAR